MLACSKGAVIIPTSPLNLCGKSPAWERFIPVKISASFISHKSSIKLTGTIILNMNLFLSLSIIFLVFEVKTEYSYS